MLHPAARCHLHANGDRAGDIHLILKGRVNAAPGDFGHNSAGHAAVEHRSVPATMQRAHRVCVIKIWHSGKGDLTV